MRQAVEGEGTEREGKGRRTNGGRDRREGTGASGKVAASAV